MLDYWRVALRKFKWDDLYDIQALINVIARDENDPYFYNLEWLHYVLSLPDVNAEENCFVATVYGGKIVGYSRINASDDPTQRTVIAGTHPDMHGIGIGRALLKLNDFNLVRIQPPKTPLTVLRRSVTAHTPSASLLSRAGYHHTSTDEDNNLLWEKTLLRPMI